MAFKTITIDLDAYEALHRQKKKGQSFSDVIKEHFERRRTARELRELLRKFELADSTLDAIDRIVEQRRSQPARAARL